MKQLYKKRFSSLEEAQQEVERLSKLGLTQARVVWVKSDG